MDKKAALKALFLFRNALEKRNINVNKLILFGSYATDTFHEGSDIDVVVISRDFEGKDFWERIKIMSKAIYEVFEPIEAIAFTPQEWDAGDSIIYEYAKNGEIILSEAA